MKKSYLIVIDMQNEVCAGIYRREELIEQINQRIITYRKAKKPIIFIQHNDDETEQQHVPLKARDRAGIYPRFHIDNVRVIHRVTSSSRRYECSG